MTQVTEVARENIRAFRNSRVGDAPILRDSILLAEANPKLVATKFIDYYHIIRDLFNLSKEELQIISRVNGELGTSRGADKFLEVMGGEKDRILESIRKMGNLEETQNADGMEELTTMMNNARVKKEADPNWIPRDGDPEADRVIWGFVKGSTSAETEIDFAICHGIERTLTGQTETENGFTGHKDWLLCAMNDVIALRGLRGQGREAKVLELWSAPRPEGLGWVTQRRLEAYKTAIVVFGQECNGDY